MGGCRPRDFDARSDLGWDGHADLTQRLALFKTALKEACEVLLMCAQYFKDVTKYGLNISFQMSYIVIQEESTVSFDYYCLACDNFTAKIDIDAAKSLAKAGLECSKKKKRRFGCVPDDSDEQSDSCAF